ncbi:hypothetical protein E1181_00825 [Saccharopolyspora terrae]|uniref:Protein phosphatase 2C domain-containing protein n=1 Tax=Saccharopolyspora terrae TaxID=2530384 RepID=A0A4R4VX19_9PSEU|nr:protein phosphatase 2C domain-containing protein [Saccharopolyspora terrae]TDD10602.1 hypothetical protein E1181_00825 [Saccharopolyspora terrae]
MPGEVASVATAQLPGSENSDDKIFVTRNAVLVLDGASAFIPVPVSASRYAAALGSRLSRSLEEAPEADLSNLLAVAIEEAAAELNLSAGESPSSTVAIVRQRGDLVDTLVLGDSAIVLPSGIVTDGRIDALNLGERSRYQERLAQGAGYDEDHTQLLRELQNQQAKHRNQSGGYWIAEADPAAAAHALTATHPVQSTPWAILVTDGALNTARHTGLDNWSDLAAAGQSALLALLDRLHEWEETDDPDGKLFPRSKRHDDKAIAAVRFR